MNTSPVAHQAGAYPCFRSTKRLGVFLLPLDEMLVHRRVTPSSKFAGTHLYTWVERSTMRVKCFAQEQNAVPRPGLEPRPFDVESSALTISPLRLPWSSTYSITGCSWLKGFKKRVCLSMLSEIQVDKDCYRSRRVTDDRQKKQQQQCHLLALSKCNGIPVSPSSLKVS